MAGQAKDTNVILWTANEAHSILNTTTNELTGGIILEHLLTLLLMTE